MSLSTQAIGYLDITNAILRVGTLDVAGIQGVDSVTNVLKGNSVLLWDDQGSDMASPPFQLGAGAARSTSPPEIDLRNASGSNFMYAGLKLPNAWLCKFDLHIADTSTGNVHVQMYTESTTSYGDDGYQFIFDGANNTVTLEYDGAEVLQESVTLTTGDWETVVVSFNRGAWTVTYGDDVVLQIDDSERADVYDNPVTGQYFRVETDASTSRKVRYFKITNNGPFLQSNTNDISYVSGNVAIGHHATEYKLSVAGSANVGALDVQSNLEVGTANLFVDTLTGRIGVGTTEPEHALDVTGNVQVGTANLFVDTVNSRVGVGTTEPGYDLDVHGSANVGALTVSSVTSNLEVGTANLFVDTLTGRVGVGTSEPAKALEVTGSLRVTDGLSNVSDLSVVQDDLTVSSNVAVSGGGLELTQVSNVAQIKSSSNVVTEFVRSKKLIKYPRVAMTQNDESSTTGYVASASSTLGAGWEAWNVFDNNRGTGWHTASSTYSTSSGAYAGSEYITDHEGTQVDGEWIKLQMPEKIRLEYVLEKPRPGQVFRTPKEETLLASNDGTTWYILATRDKATFNDKISKIWEIRAQQYYKYYALVVEKIGYKSNAESVQLMEIEYYGVPEYDSDAHGTDVMLKAVPNDLPSTSEWLELYWDAEDYSSASDFSGSNEVLDKSGNSKHGTQTGGVGLSTINGIKAFTFDGSTNSIDTQLSNPSGAWVHSVCVWIYMNDFKNSCQVFGIDDTDPPVYSNDSTAYLVIDSDGAIRYDFHYNPHYSSVGQITPRKWHHVCVQYNGTRQDEFGTSMFIDGIRQRTDRNIHGNVNYSGNQLNIGANAYLFLGGLSFLGNIANFRLHNRVLSDDEVWQFYASQKEHFDVSSNVIGFKNGRMGVGTDEPRAVLDVRGNIFANGRPALPLPVAQFYKKSDGTASQSYTENIRTGRVDWDSVLIDAPGVIERYYWDTSAVSGDICTDGTYTGGVFKFCLPGTYIVSIHLCISKQSAHSVAFGTNLFDCGIGGRFTVGAYDGRDCYGNHTPDTGVNHAQYYEKTHIVHVSAAPAYAWVRIQPSANNSYYFRFETYGPTPYAAANIIYLG